MLVLKNGYWTLNGEKYKELTATDAIIFDLLIIDEKCKKNVKSVN